jgi:cytochrome P450
MLRIEPFDDPNLDPVAILGGFLAHSELASPYPAIAELRKQGPVHQLDMRVHLGLQPDPLVADLDKYAVISYEGVKSVFDNPTVFTSGVLERSVGRMFGHVLTVMDAPEHHKYRPFFMKAFLPNVIAKWGETVVEPIIKGLMDKFVARGKADLANEFAVYYPFLFICRQLGLLPEDEETYLKMTSALMLVYVDPVHAEEANSKLGRYYKQRIDQARGQLGDDMLTRMANAEIDGEYLPDEILISMLRLMLSGASETTYRATTSLLTGLLTHPEQLKALYQDRSLLPLAIEEGLRWEPPVTFVQRMTMCDFEVSGVMIPKGSLVEAWNGAANRDPAVFENPDEFNIFRKPHRHFTFSAGPHVCLGQHLGKLELTRAFNALLDRLPNLRLDPDYSVPKVMGINGRAAAEVRVLFDH